MNERNDSHELYDLGHLFEAAVAHYQATGKKTLLDIAIRAADLLTRTFGPGKRSIWPGHQITEMGLVKMYRVTGNEQYLALAKFMLDERGPDKIPAGETVNPRGLDYNQAQRRSSIRPSRSATPSARCTCMPAWPTSPRWKTTAKMRAAGDAIWNSLVKNKLYLTGGIGAAGGHEGFGAPYDLPNMSAYNETCASVGMDFWNQRLVPAARRRAVRGRDGAHALQRVDLRRLAQGRHLLLRQPARVERPARAPGVVRRRLLPGQHHAVHGVGARLCLRASGRHAATSISSPAGRRTSIWEARSRSRRRRAIRGTARCASS